MIREKLGKIFSSRVFYIVFSILVSFALWMFVEINENQMQRFTVNYVPIVRQNEELLTDRGLLIGALNPETVSFTFESPRSVETKLTNTTLSVVIDLAGITSRGSTSLSYDIEYPSDLDINSLNIVSRSVSRISLYIDRLDTKSVPVNVVYDGGTAENYIQDSPVFSPQSITVSGPADVVSQVGTARVYVIRENLASTYTDDLNFVLYDERGDRLDESLLDTLTVSEETIHVSIPIRMVKTVNLAVDFIYGSGATLQNTMYSIEPATIMVAGDPEDLRDFNTLNLGPPIDLTNFEQNRSVHIPIALENLYTSLSGETEALVSVEVRGLEIKYLSVTNYQFINEPVDLTVNRITQSTVVRIRGRAEDLEALTVDDIVVRANLSDVSTGTQQIPARVIIYNFDGDSDSIGAIGNYIITVDIRET